jgi:predicted Zn-dependent protease
VVLAIFSLRIRRAAPRVIGDSPYRQNAIGNGDAIPRQRKHEAVLALLIVACAGIGVLQGRRWSCIPGVPASCKPQAQSIYVIPVGGIDAAFATAMTRHLAECYALPAKMGAAYLPDSTMWDVDRKQWRGEAILAGLERACVESDRGCDGALVIGVTNLDIYTTRQQWRFAFAVRGRNVALVSTARMGTWFGGRAASRARKMLARTIALQYCGEDLTSDPRSLRAPSILGARDLDRIDEANW